MLPRVIEIPSGKEEMRTVILLEEIIERNIHKLFLSYDVVCAHPYRIMRNADLTIDEDEAEDLLVEIQETAEKTPVGRSDPSGSGRKDGQTSFKDLKSEFDIKNEDIFLNQRSAGSDDADEDLRTGRL